MNMPKPKYVFVIPCSGIGKSMGTVGRKATYKVIEKLRPQNTRTTCLPLLTVGDQETLKKVRENPCISIDGCPAKCAQKNIEASNGKLIKSFLVIDTIRNHRNLKPEGIIELNPEGCKLVNIIAKDVAKAVDEIMESEC
jgi:uncharacterized metal-binding protein